MIRWSDAGAWRLAMLNALALLAACGESPAPPPPGAANDGPALPAELAEIEASSRELPMIEGQSRDGDVQIVYRAFVEEDTTRFVEEVVTGEYGATRDRYYFEGGRLIYFHREGSQLTAMPPEPPGLGDVVMFVAFDQTGRPTRQLKRLKGQSAGIETFELTAIASRARELTREVALKRRPVLAEDEFEGYLVMGEPLTTFQPCGDARIYWLDADAAEMSGLRADYDRIASRPLEPLYARVKGEIGDRITTGLASNYPAVFTVTSHSSLSRRQDRDCP